VPDEFDILVINPGSTSTKFAVYRDAEPFFVVNLRHTAEELAPFRGKPILEQQEFRRQKIEEELAKRDYRISQLKAVVGRGGLLHPLASGTYCVNDQMLEELRRAERGEHAANLGAFLAKTIADEAGARHSSSIR